jgi:hypothetical protein
MRVLEISAGHSEMRMYRICPVISAWAGTLHNRENGLPELAVHMRILTIGNTIVASSVVPVSPECRKPGDRTTL